MFRDVLLSAEVLVAAVALLLILFLVLTFARRRAIGRGKPLVLCAIRLPGETRWRVGMARYGSSRLDWFRLGGFTVRARARWHRTELQLDSPYALQGRDRIGLVPDAVGVPCHYRGSTCELALAP